MRTQAWMVSLMAAATLAACDAMPVRSSGGGERVERASGGSVLAQLAGEYDNHAQRPPASDTGGKGSDVPPPTLHQWLRRSDDGLLWHLKLTGGNAEDGRWLLREDGNSLVPYRPLTPAARAYFDEKADSAKFRYDASQWAPLTACTLRRDADTAAVVFRVDAGACGALWPGLGESAALLPLRFELKRDILTLSTVADAARGAGAATVSQRVRWFTGWDAINGAGAKANASSPNQDWHLRRDVRLHDQGSRIPLLWRDGKPTGYSIELSRMEYRESKTEVLRLALIEDADGKIISYAWANPDATRIGLNLGWLQVGLDVDDGSAKAK